MPTIESLIASYTVERQALEGLETTVHAALQAHAAGEPLPPDVTGAAELLRLGIGLDGVRELHGRIGARLGDVALAIVALEAETV